MTPLCRDNVIDSIGELDEFIIAQLIATGGSIQALAEAMVDLEFAHEVGETLPRPSSPAVQRIRDILAPVFTSNNGYWPIER